MNITASLTGLFECAESLFVCAVYDKLETGCQSQAKVIQKATDTDKDLILDLASHTSPVNCSRIEYSHSNLIAIAINAFEEKGSNQSWVDVDALGNLSFTCAAVETKAFSVKADVFSYLKNVKLKMQEIMQKKRKRRLQSSFKFFSFIGSRFGLGRRKTTPIKDKDPNPWQVNSFGKYHQSFSPRPVYAFSFVNTCSACLRFTAPQQAQGQAKKLQVSASCL